MSKIKITKEDLIGVWENKDVAPFSYKDDIEITLFLGSNNVNNIMIEREGIQTTYFSQGFEVSDTVDGKFTITLKKSELNDGNDVVIDCRMFLPNKPLAFIANIRNLNDRYFVKV